MLACVRKFTLYIYDNTVGKMRNCVMRNDNSGLTAVRRTEPNKNH